jgi:cytochrome c-type biogenesis protein CcmE
MTNATVGKIVLTCAVAIGGVGFLVYSALGDTAHYKMVHQLVADGFAKWQDKELQVHGYVEAGSIIESVVDQETQRTFVLQKEGKKIRVFSKGTKPDNFSDQSEVVATGRLVLVKDVQLLADALCNAKPQPGCPIHPDAEQPYVLAATELMAKCPSKYKGAPTIKLDTKFR